MRYKIKLLLILIILYTFISCSTKPQNTLLNWIKSNGIKNPWGKDHSIKSLKLIKSLDLGDKGLDDTALQNLSAKDPSTGEIIFQKVKSLHLSENNITGKGLFYLNHLKSLKHLYLGNTKITDAGLSNIKDFSSLEILVLWNTSISDEGIKHLRNLKNLRELYLSGTKITDKSISDLKSIKSLRILDIYKTSITDTQANILIKSLDQCYIIGPDDSKSYTDKDIIKSQKWLDDVSGGEFKQRTLEDMKNMDRLDIQGPKINNLSLNHIIPFENLDTLNINKHTHINDSGLVFLRGLKKLNTLRLWWTNTTGSGLVHIKDLKIKTLFLIRTPLSDVGSKYIENIKSLENLILRGSSISNKSLERFKNLPNLIELNVVWSTINDDGLAVLKDYKKLRMLDISGSNITDKGMEHLSKLKHLYKLILWDTNITDHGLELLKKIKTLKIIDLRGSKVTKEGAEQFRKYFKNCSDCSLNYNRDQSG